MKLSGNTILITGGGSGIGRGLAEYFAAHDNTVIIAGRNKTKLDEVAEANEHVHVRTFDVTDPNSIKQLATEVARDFPQLNGVIHNAGIMQPEVIGEDDVDVSDTTIATNLIGQIHLNSALLPHLKTVTEGMIMTVSSGLAFIPRADFPTYCATKAAIHSYSQSLRTQLNKTGIQVIELIPPYVQTELTGSHQATDERAMPLRNFIAEVTSILERDPDVKEIAVERVLFQRTAESSGEYDTRYLEFQHRFGNLD